MQLTVRTKLALLVGSPILLIGTAVPILAYLQHAELTDAADDQVQAAERSFEAEAEDDFADLRLAALIMSTSGKTRRAVQDANPKEGLQVAQVFAKLYPRIDILLALRDGRVVCYGR